jgi:phage terminase large subunit-like protein
MTGRGFGKTLTGANWAISKGLSEPGIWVAVCAPTFADVKNTCFEGPSGIKNIAQPGEIIDHNKNDLRITLRNGSIIQGYSAEKAESIRGANLAYCWFDELGIIRYPEFYEAGLLPALRVSKGQLMITTTPRNTRLLREIIKEAETNPGEFHFTRATSSENWKAPGVTKMIAKVTSKFGEGTFLERQELQGEFIAEIPGALFQVEWFDRYRVDFDEVPEFRRVLIAVDPASSSSVKSDETGIVVAAEGEDRHLYVLQDCSLQGTPDAVMDALVTAYYRWGASLVVGEKNGVGDYFKVMLYNKDPFIPFKAIQAMNAKKIRAQPISPLAEQGRLHMVGDRLQFEELERQLCALTSYDDRVKAHDDRADACIGSGVMISTSAGDIPIEDIRPGDNVWTRQGWRPVTAARRTQENAEVGTITLSDGRELTGTPDHKIWTEDKGWVRLDALMSGDILSGWTSIPQPVPVSVVHSYVTAEPRDVYDLSVKDVHEFTASGVIVHNCVYALRELCGFAAVNYKEIYGFSACKKCDADVHVYIDKTCKRCGTPVAAEAKPKDPKHAKSAVRWSAAYYRICPDGHEYPMKLMKCPECKPDAAAYLQRAASLSGGSGLHGYSGRDWLAGRKI